MQRLPDHLKCMLPPLEDQLRQVMEFVREFQDVFVGSDGKVGFTEWVKPEINTGDKSPMKLGTSGSRFLRRSISTGK